MQVIDEFRGKYDFLSNMYEIQLVIDGETYRSVENYFQAMKSDSPGTRRCIAAANPISSKMMGRRVKLTKDWNIKKIGVMEKALTVKFNDPLMRQKLIATAGMKLVEGNTWNDTFWGMYNGKGMNVLGCMLMRIRDKIISELTNIKPTMEE